MTSSLSYLGNQEYRMDKLAIRVGQISDEEFVKGLEWLISSGMVKVHE